MSSFSVDIGVLEVCELRDIELLDGDRAPEGRSCGLTGTGGARFLPLPSTLPPPRLLLAAMLLTLPGHWTCRETANKIFNVPGRAATVRTLPLVSKAEFRHAGCWSRCSAAPSTKVKLARPATCHDVGFTCTDPRAADYPLPFSGTGLISHKQQYYILKKSGFGNPLTGQLSTTT